MQELEELYEKKLAEKDKEYKEQLKRMYEQFKHYKEFEITQYKFETKQQQLYKEDFKKIIITSYSSKNHTNIESWKLKDNSLYDKLPSKDVK